MAEIAIGVVISIAISTASTLVAKALAPNNEASRLSDINPLKASFGENLPYVWGTAKLPGIIFWSRPLEEYVYKKQYKYRGTCGVAFCTTFPNRPMTFRSIYGNKRGMWSSSQPTVNKYNFEFHDGGNNTSKSSRIVNDEGAANVPFFKRLTYITMGSAKLQTFGFSLPNFEAIVRLQGATPSLATVLTDVCGLAGITSSGVSFSEPAFFNDTLIHSAVLRNDGSTYKSFIEELQIVYNFSMRESNGNIEFTPAIRTGVTTVISQKQIGTQPENQGTEKGKSDDDTFNLYKKQEESDVDLPSVIQVEYLHRDNNFRKSNSNYAEVTQSTPFTKSLSVPNIGLTPAEAAELAQRNFSFARASTTRYAGISMPYMQPNPAFNTNWVANGSQGLLVPGNAYNIPLEAQSTTQIVLEAELSTSFIVNLSTQDYIAGTNFVGIIPPEEIDLGFVLGDDEVTPVIFETSPLLPIPLNSYTNIQYLAGSKVAPPATFGTGEAFVEKGGIDFSGGQVTGLSIEGTIVGLLPVASFLVYDNSTVIDIDFVESSPTFLTNLTDDEWLDAKQVIYIQATGELILVKNASYQGAGVYRCSGFIRGWQGTETKIAASVNSKVFICKAPDIIGQLNALNNCQVSSGSFNLATSYYHKILDTDVDEATYTSTLGINRLFSGESLKPFAPWVTGTTIVGSGFNLNWTYRARGYFSDNFNPPLNEDSLLYDIEFYNSTFTAVTQTSLGLTAGVYGFTPALIAALTSGGVISFRIYQVSGTVGRGKSFKYALDPLTLDVQIVP